MLTNTFVLSLEDAVERRKPLINEFGKNAIAHELWLAVGGRNCLFAADEKRVDRKRATKRMGRVMLDAGIRLRPVTLRCLSCNHGTWNGARIILENDAILTLDFVDLVRNFAMQDDDLLLLDHWRAQV